MARLDVLIERLSASPGAQLVLETGGGARLETAAGPQRLIHQALTTRQIMSALLEVVPQPLQAGLTSERPIAFTYTAPAGLVEVRVEVRDDGVRAWLSLARDLGPSAEPAGGTPIAAAPPASAAPDPAPPPAAPPRPAITVARPDDPRAAMEALLAALPERRASDLHLASDSVPALRLDGDVVQLGDYGPLSPERVTALVWSIAPAKNREEWEQIHDTDFAHETAVGRFRANVFADRNGIGAVFRVIPHEIPSAEALGIPPAVLELCHLSKGLVLVTGPTGSGKSTTLAALIDHVNRNRDDHIITIEDPIEFVHPNKRCIVNQREVGTHTESFKRALRAALREDPDIILVGELRDLETIAIAIETAETGHLVFGTLHTNTAPSTVDRIIDQFPADRQEQIRMMLSESLKGVISQTLCKRIGGGRAAALEILLCPPSVANLIREGKTFQIPSVMQTARGQGMATLNDGLVDLVKRRVIEPAEAYKKAVAKSELKGLLERAGFPLV
jgi:twitching motility protein PilT